MLKREKRSAASGFYQSFLDSIHIPDQNDIRQAIKALISNVRNNPARFILYLITFVLAVLFTTWFVHQEKYIYFWDYALYHTLYRDLGEMLASRPVKALFAIKSSIRKADYNYLPALLLMPFYFIFGGGRQAYISSLAITFAFPAIVLFSILIGKLAERAYGKERTRDLGFLLIPILTLLLLPQFWVPLLLGYVDAVGVVVIFIILITHFRTDLEYRSRSSLIGLGLLLCLLILLRRWYAYWVVGFFVAASVQMVFKRIDGTNADSKSLVLAAKNLLTVGLVAVVSFFIIATPIAKRMLFTDYGDIYSAYKGTNTVFEILGRSYNHFGPLLILLAGLGLLTALLRKELQSIGLFLIVQLIVAYILHNRTQDIDIHHFYFIIATLAILIALFLINLYAQFKAWVLRVVLITIVLAVGTANLLITVYPSAERELQQVSFLFSRLRQYPKKRSDLDEVHRLLKTLNDLTSNSERKVYVLTSAISMNTSVLKNGCFMFERSLHDLERKIMFSCDVDKRDGFPFQFLKADYVVMTEPIGYHLRPEDQRVVGVLAEYVINGEGMGKAYRKLPFEFTLEDNRKTFIYEKVAPFETADLKKVSDQFLGWYPDKAEKFRIQPEVIKEVSAKQ